MIHPDDPNFDWGAAQTEWHGEQPHPLEPGHAQRRRGLGLMVGVELTTPARVAAVQRHCLEQGHVILMNAGPHGEVLRWMPPLVATAEDIDIGLDAFGTALRATA